MRIVIDMQGAQTESRFRGIGRYTMSLAKAFVFNAGEHDVWIALNARLPDSIPDIRAEFIGLLPPDRIRIFDVPEVMDSPPWLSGAAELIREAYLASLQPDIVLLSSLFEGYWANAVTSIGKLGWGGRTAVILYDLIPLLNEKTYLPTDNLKSYYFQKIEWLKKADLLLAISESSRDEGITYLGFSPEKVRNISAAIGSEFKPPFFNKKEKKAFFSRLGIKKRPILYAPGGFDQRKNFNRLIQAYSLLDQGVRDRCQLVIVSKLNQPQRAELLGYANNHGLHLDEMILTGYLDEQDLIAMYSLAEVFVFPSTHEGFGLPILEAMSCGAPVIGSNCSSVPEVIDLAEALFDPFSATSIAEKITEVLTNTEFRSRLVEHAQKQSNKFSWDESARKAIAAIEKIPTLNRPKIDVLSQKNTLLQTLAKIPMSIPSEKEVCEVAKSIAYNFGNADGKQLLLDVSTIVHSDAKSGIQRVVRSLLIELLNNHYVCYSVRPIYYEDGIYRYANRFSAKIVGSCREEEDLPIDFSQGDNYLSLDLNMHLAEQMRQIHRNMKLYGVHLNFIVYDILLVQRPDWWLPPNPDFFRTWLQDICSVGDTLVCISQAVAHELREWIKLNQPVRSDNGPFITHFHLGADIDNSLPTLGLPEDFLTVIWQLSQRLSFLMVGTIEPRKGHTQVLDAFEHQWNSGADLNLVIVGRPGWLVDDLVQRLRSHHELNRRLFWLEGISDEYLEKVYAACTCLIAASYGEGFGLPLIEAAQHKLPIIARDIPVFREVAGEYAFYFEGTEPSQLSGAIEEWIELYQQGTHPNSDNIPWLTWRESAGQLFEKILPKDESNK